MRRVTPLAVCNLISRGYIRNPSRHGWRYVVAGLIWLEYRQRKEAQA